MCFILSISLAHALCSDSDRGINSQIKGTVESKLAERENSIHVYFTDFCIDKSQLKEYYCLRDVVVFQVISCGSTQVCSDGMCIQKKTEVLVTESESAYTEYSDSAINYGSYVAPALDDDYALEDTDEEKDTLTETRSVQDEDSGQDVDDTSTQKEDITINDSGQSSSKKQKSNSQIVEEPESVEVQKKVLTYDSPYFQDKESSCKGCLVNNACLSYGLRFQKTDGVFYCSTSGQTYEQKQNGMQCTLSYECLSNSCNNGYCETRSQQSQPFVLEKAYIWLSKVFVW